MLTSLPSVCWAALSLVLAVGGTTALVAGRAASECRWLWFHRLYTACLVCVGACTLVGLGHRDSCWVLSALAYAGLTLAATWERQELTQVGEPPFYPSGTNN